MKKGEVVQQEKLIHTDEDQMKANSRRKDMQKRVAENVAASTAKESSAALMKKYAKPDKYTGNRTLYDSGKAKRDVKVTAFQDNKVVIDPYTGQKLELRKADAKAKYGNDWANHLAEGDHIVPLEEIFNQNKDSAWLSNEDIKSVANSEKNLQAVSRKFNNAKRSRTQKNLTQDQKYLDKTGLELSEESKKKAVEVGDKAQKDINKNFTKSKIGNVVKEGHHAGTQSAKNAAIAMGAMSLTSNTTALIKGDKELGEAAVDVASNTTKAAIAGYGTGAGLTVLTNTLAHSSSEFIKTLAKSNILGDVVSMVMSTGKSLVRYVNDEISMHEMTEEIAVAGVEIIANAVGFACGGPLGSIVAGMLVSTACGMVLSVKEKLVLNEKNYQYQVSLMSKIEKEALQEIQFQRKYLEDIINKEFQGWDDSYERGFQMLLQSAKDNDFSGFAGGIDTIMSIFQSKAAFHEVEEVEEFLFDDNAVFEF